MRNNQLDYGWFKRHLLEDILLKWLHSSVSDSGLFLPNLDRDWNPIGDKVGTLVSQSRLLYNFSQGYRLTQEAGYLEAVQKGAHFLMERFWDQKYGGWFWSCDSSGKVIDSTKNSYGHAFAIFGLSHAYRATGDSELKKAALETHHLMETKFKDYYGGLTYHMSRNFRSNDSVKSQNPIMHYFEALLALQEIDETNKSINDMKRIADFLLSRLVRLPQGYLPELYTLDWEELPENRGAYMEIGHAPEWAYLLSRAVEKGLSESYLEVAEKLLEYSLKVGYDQEVGGFFIGLSPQGEIILKNKIWWQQCEGVRALMHYLILRGRNEFGEPLLKTIAFIKNSFIDKEYGGWFEEIDDEGRPTAQEKGNTQKVDYHIVGMCMEALRLEQE